MIIFFPHRRLRLRAKLQHQLQPFRTTLFECQSKGTRSHRKIVRFINIYVHRAQTCRNQKKKFNIMRFNASVGVDFTKWSQVKMERENNQVQFKSFSEDMPKFGAGSEFGREQREEARRKKFGIYSKKYKPEDQPWIIQHGGKTGKKFRGKFSSLEVKNKFSKIETLCDQRPDCLVVENRRPRRRCRRECLVLHFHSG